MRAREQTRVLLIEDSRKVSHDLSIVLEFLGESLVVSDRRNWKAVAEEGFSGPEAVSLAIIGRFSDGVRARLLGELIEWHEGLPLVLLGGEEARNELPASLSSRIAATIPLPLSYQPVLDALHKGRVYREHYQRLRDLGGVRDFNMFRSLVGRSPAIQHIRQTMGQVANTEATVLITGESGTGKEVVARNLHMNSARANKPFVPINCGAIPPDLLESELFGHEKGAFTGAIASRAGRFELAEGGTLFLDEIGDMPLPMQVKLLRVIQEQSYERVGGTRTLRADVRILAATHKNLEEMIEEGSFRQDLYYRINVFPVEMPSLRERAEDIPYLLNELISRLENEGRGSVRFNSGAIRSLARHPWPGNVRELANLVERMAILHSHGVVGVNDLPEQFRHIEEGEDIGEPDAALLEPSTDQDEPETAPGPPAGLEVERRSRDRGRAGASAGNGSPPDLLPLTGLDLKEYLANLERDLIEQAIEDSEGVVARAAERLHIRRTTLVEKMRKYGLQKK